MTISRELVHAAREQLQIIMGNLELAMITGRDKKKQKMFAEKAKTGIRELARLLKVEPTE